MSRPKPRRSKRIWRWVETTLLLAGLAAVGVWIGSIATMMAWQDWENWVFDRATRGQKATVTGYLAETKNRIADQVRAWMGDAPTARRSEPPPRVPSESAPAEPAPRPAIQHNELIGRLSIPRLHLRAIVREGSHEDTLSLAAGHIPSTALPGQTGNVGVAGHRDTLFRGLGAIHPKDVIRFETLHGNYEYEVSGTEIVKPRNVEVLNAGAYPELTLVTCYPFSYFGSAPDRFIVKAREISQSAAEETPSETRQEILKEAAEEIPARHGPRKIAFSVSKDHSRQLVPGISLGLTGTDMIGHRVNGWMWLMPDRRTIWLRDHAVKDPLVFYGYADGKRRELQITNVSQDSMTGYLVLDR